MSATTVVVGFYGKLPMRGDFVTRGLTRHFIEPWDAWLQAALAESRRQLDQTWLDCYLTSPLWRFALSPGLCGEAAHAGVLMPSVDRVGRHFPLVLATPLADDTNLLALTTADWFERAEQAALAGLDSDLELDQFAEGVQALGAPPGESAPVASGAGAAWRWSLPDLAALDAIGVELADWLLRERFLRYSLWWSHGSDRIAPGFLVCPDLPQPAGFAALLAGDWQRWGWGERPLTRTL